MDILDKPMLTVDDLAGLLHCSTRSIYRLSDAGKLPKPIKVGSLNRWKPGEIESWIAAGCPRVDRGRALAL